MFFSPNMHSQLKYLLQDGKLPKLTDDLFKELDPAETPKYYEKVNLLLYENAQLNALSYFGDVYISRANSLNKMPIATSKPNPWQLFVID